MMLHERVSIMTLKDVYEPGEDSFLLAKVVEETAFGKVLDMCTGSGIQGIVAALKGCDVTFSDVDETALECAANNAEANHVKGKFVKSDLFQNIKGRYNTIIFNPPYLPSEPSGRAEDPRLRALDGGKNGRRFIDRFIDSYKEHVLEDHIVLIVESSFNGYARDVRSLKAKVVAKAHYFFEDIVVLEFGRLPKSASGIDEIRGSAPFIYQDK